MEIAQGAGSNCTHPRDEPPGEYMRALLAHTLESAGYATDACTDGVEGVETVLATSPDLVTVDVNRPGAPRRCRRTQLD